MFDVLCHLVPWRRRIEVLVSRKVGCDLDVGQPLVMRRVPEGELIGEPTFTLDLSDAQELIDELWRCGIRPSEGSGSAGSLAATQRHLEDMRRLVFKDGAR